LRQFAENKFETKRHYNKGDTGRMKECRRISAALAWPMHLRLRKTSRLRKEELRTKGSKDEWEIFWSWMTMRICAR